MHNINKQLYRNLLQKGMTLKEVDESDILFLFDLYSDDEPASEIAQYADQVPWL